MRKIKKVFFLRHCKLLYIIFFCLSFCSCVSSKYKSKEYGQKIIQLHSNEESSKIIVYNKHAKIYLERSEVESFVRKNITLEENKIFLENISSPKKDSTFLDNNLNVQTPNQIALFPIVWELLLKGDAKVYDVKNMIYVDKIEFENINNITGISECFILPTKIVFISKIIAIGE